MNQEIILNNIRQKIHERKILKEYERWESAVLEENKELLKNEIQM